MWSGACYLARREEAELLFVFAADRSHTNIRLDRSFSWRLVLQELHQKTLDGEHLVLQVGQFVSLIWYQDEDGKHKLPQNEVTAIKRELIGLMILVPPNIQYQLGDAIGVIADSDFWERWDSLVDVSH